MVTKYDPSSERLSTPFWPFFTEDILTCHSRKSTGINNNKKILMAEFHLAASVSGTWCCACWLIVMAYWDA